MNPRDEQLLADGSARVGNAASPFKLKNILVPIDFSDYSLKALQYALPFAKQHGAKITLIQVIEPVYYPENFLGVLPPECEKVNIDRARAAKRQLADLRQLEIGLETPAEIVVRTGRPYEEIINAAKEHDINLIIISTHGHSGLKRVFLGSTAERVVRHAPCPVLVVREPEYEFI